jgi:hypothetical protein
LEVLWFSDCESIAGQLLFYPKHVINPGYTLRFGTATNDMMFGFIMEERRRII